MAEGSEKLSIRKRVEIGEGGKRGGAPLEYFLQGSQSWGGDGGGAVNGGMCLIQWLFEDLSGH